MENEKNLKEIPESALEGVSGGTETFEPGEKAIVDGSIHVFIMGYMGDSMYCVLMPSGAVEQVHASRISRP